ncbi:unnamed protein product [Effrenium voratum]|uniref:Uncharacterized protein n=1 Tax=Effrenium voratum TaxID=2562239 RepID=A0AA36I1J4_9DINO|nr:unnamed protein product [Effrenium voratum]
MSGRKRRKADVVPQLASSAATLEGFHQAFGWHQVLFVPRRGACTKRGRVGLATLRRLYAAYPAVMRRAFSLESGRRPAPETLQKLLAQRPPPGSKCALEQFLAQALPEGVPNFLRPNGKAKAKAPRHSRAAWVFFGRNSGQRALRGRPEHTDAIQHSGTWHVQLKGEKVWTLSPTAELQKQVPSLKGAGRVRVHCKEGDVLCINTRLWWHKTHIPPNCKLSMSVARDMYLDGTRPGACDMTNVEGHYALRPIRKGAVIFTEEEAPQLQLPRSSDANCELQESQSGGLVVAAKRAVKKGEWFSLSDSEEEAPRARKRKR